ncbi:unnamed protein product [Boreogadus saida]
MARVKLAEHLATCPASVVCCTMEWTAGPSQLRPTAIVVETSAKTLTRWSSWTCLLARAGPEDAAGVAAGDTHHLPARGPAPRIRVDGTPHSDERSAARAGLCQRGQCGHGRRAYSGLYKACGGGPPGSSAAALRSSQLPRVMDGDRATSTAPPVELGYAVLERKLQNVGMSLFPFNGHRSLLSDTVLAPRSGQAVDRRTWKCPDGPNGRHGTDFTAHWVRPFSSVCARGGRISACRLWTRYHIDFGRRPSPPSAILATNTMVGDNRLASAATTPALSCPHPALPHAAADLVLECVALYQTKQRSTVHLVCGQLCARSESPPTSRQERHGTSTRALNGWMEHRCLPASYGCTYFPETLLPSCSALPRVIHDRLLSPSACAASSAT